MDLAQVMKKFVNDETILEYKSLTKKVENIARKDGRREGIQEGTQVVKHYNVLISVDTIKIAKNLLNLNIDISTIMQSTGLSKQEILNL